MIATQIDMKLLKQQKMQRDTDHVWVLLVINKLKIQPIFEGNPFDRSFICRFYSAFFSSGKRIHDTCDILTMRYEFCL